MKKRKLRTLLVWTLILLALVALLQLEGGEPAPSAGFDRFLADVAEGRVSGVRLHDNRIRVTLRDGAEYATVGLIDGALTRQLSEQGVLVAWGEPSTPLRTLLVVGLPLLLFVALFLYFLRKQGGGTANVLSLRKSRARLLSEEARVSFADVGGCEQAKAQLGDVIDFLRHPEHWTGAGVRLPRGLLLEGPPGCGKTLLARAVAGETEARFYLVSASEFVEMFVGVGAARVRDMFETAAKNAPAVIFIDELDAVGRRRGSGIGAAHDEREQTLNQILVCMDGFEQHHRVVVIAATNRPDILDGALLRPGRFDRRIRIPPLGRKQRAQVLALHARNKKLAPEVCFEELAERSEGFTGADLEALVNEAGLLAVRRGRQTGSGEVVLAAEDFARALQAPDAASEPRFDRVDALLIESTTQLSQATGRAVVRLRLMEGTDVEGELVWADASFVKVRGAGGGETIVPKCQIKTIEALAGTEPADPEDLAPDRWAGRSPELA